MSEKSKIFQIKIKLFPLSQDERRRKYRFKGKLFSIILSSELLFWKC